MGARQEPQGEQPIYVFGAFRLLRQSRQLFLGAAPVRLGGRALELLLVLVERAGEVVSRAELERTIWPDSVVEDSCLRVHIGALRKALGDGPGASRYIANIPGRGYSFVAPVVALGPACVTGPGPAPAAGARPLPLRMTSVLGRDEVLDQLRALLPRCHLVTIVGHGGIGKTTLALCLASELRGAYADGACFVDLALLTSGIQVPDALAACLGLEPGGEGVRALLERWLAPRRMLVVLDNCEHLIDAATHLAECLLRLAPGIDIVATSREPLDADGEWVLRLGPLACPPDDPALSLEQAMAYPALQLLASRAQASMDSFRLGRADLPAAIKLCRRLDGVPLAIEFAAAQVALLGVQGVVEQLNDRLRLLGSGRRTVLPRHRTLRALLDWSHDLLSPDERRVLRCCAVFVGPFTLEAALAVAGPGAARCVVACVLGLVSKSLLWADTQGPDARFVLLGITRAYAIERLAEDPERHALARRHAQHTLALLEECEQAWNILDHDAWLASSSHVVGNLRAALDWAFGPGGERALGVRLVAAPAVLGSTLLGERELGRHVRMALEAIGAGAAADPLLTARLHAAIAGEVVDWGPYERAVAHAEAGGRAEALAEALYVFAARCQAAGLYRSAHEHGLRMARVAAQAGLARALAVARRLPAASLHMLGEHDEALWLAGKAPAVRPPLRLAATVAGEVEHAMLVARTRWLQGEGRAAAALARNGLMLAAADGAPASLAWALALGALPVALWRGDDSWAHELAGQLEDLVERHALAYWNEWARLYRQVLAARAGRGDAPGSPAWRTDAVQGDHLATFLGGLVVEAGGQRCAQGQVGWCAAEVWRASGERLLLGQGGEAAAEALFLRALAVARRQGALGWELRCATSLARLWREWGDGNASRRGVALLEPLVLALGDGHDGADRRAALRLLQE
ncbi:winged helix-turn-helix domain-containing protein [Massilia sp. HP4]|uniref:ATP-binding protein n=1 Tax=Massilia sp. HP4 TaxID=2562316 RepID=UPI00148521B0|nr:winged helix-turn-helix domain-containing protein [Massilia sp. HP4]